MIGQALWEWGARLGETFDMFGHVPGDHCVHELGHACDNRHLEHIACTVGGMATAEIRARDREPRLILSRQLLSPWVSQGVSPASFTP